MVKPQTAVQNGTNQNDEKKCIQGNTKFTKTKKKENQKTAEIKNQTLKQNQYQKQHWTKAASKLHDDS